MLPDVSRLRIGDRVAGDGAPLFVIAEIGLNHDGSIDRALALVDAAAAAGASGVKVQALIADELVTANAPAPMHVDSVSLVDFFRQYELTESDYARVAARAHDRGLAFIATPFSERAVDMLGRVGVDAWKIASGDITWERLVQKCGATRQPVIVSTGMSSCRKRSAPCTGRRGPGRRVWITLGVCSSGGTRTEPTRRSSLIAPDYSRRRADFSVAAAR